MPGAVASGAAVGMPAGALAAAPTGASGAPGQSGGFAPTAAAVGLPGAAGREAFGASPQAFSAGGGCVAAPDFVPGAVPGSVPGAVPGSVPGAGVPGAGVPGAGGLLQGAVPPEAAAPLSGNGERSLRHSGLFLRSEQSDRYWKRVLVGDLRCVPEEVRRRAGADEPELDEDERRYRLAGAINRSWVSDHGEYSREYITENWGRMRAELARRLGVVDDEEELFRAISLRSDEDPLRRMARDLFEGAYAAGLEGQEAFDPGASLQQLQAPQQQAARLIVFEGLTAGQAQRERYLPLAQRVADGLRAYDAAESQLFSAPDVVASLPALSEAAGQLAEMPQQERYLVYHLAAGLRPTGQAGQASGAEGTEDEGLGSAMLRAVRRGSVNLGVGAAQALGQFSSSLVRHLGENLDDSLGTDMAGGAEVLDRHLVVHDELRRLAQHEVYPLGQAAGASRVEQYLIDAAQATPSSVLAFCSGAGFAGLTLSGVGEAVAEARSRAPMGDRDLQLAAGVIAGTIQAGIYAGLGKLGSQALEQSVASLVRAGGSGVKGYSAAALRSLSHLTGESVRLLLAGKAAMATDLATQELAARVDVTASNIDWRAFGDNLTDIEANMRESAMLLPYLLIASGRVALRHFRSREQVLGDGSALLDWGLSEKEREAVMRETDLDVQGERLREALRKSPRWSSPDFPEEAMRSLLLLNTDYFRGFSEPKVVRDFLRLPAESSGVKREEFPALREGDKDAEDRVLKRPWARSELLQRSERLSRVLPIWDAWWSKSHLLSSSDTSPRSQNRRIREETFGRRLRYAFELRNPSAVMQDRLEMSGAYAPHAEEERRLVIADRFAEIQDLSYQFLLNSYTLDSMLRTPEAISSLVKRSERMRQSLLGGVAQMVLGLASGKSRQEVLKDFAGSFNYYYKRRSFQISAPQWMREAKANHLRHLDRLLEPANRGVLDDVPNEVLQAVRVLAGLEACGTALFDLLPLSPGFMTALSRGMTPMQAYGHLLGRELQLDEKQRLALPEDARFDEASAQDISEYTESNRELYERYRSLTGRGLESSEGEDGQTYWRVLRPNGRYTHWHAQPEQAINELAAQSSLSFMLYNTSPRRLLQEGAVRRALDLSSWLPVRPHEYSAYDRLCSIALDELSRFWQGSALRMQPGMEVKRLRYRFRIGARNLGISPILKPRGAPGSGYEVDAFSVATPLGMIQARLHAFWRRQLGSEAVDAQQAGRLLVASGVLREDQVQRILRAARPSMRERRQGALSPDKVERRNARLARHLAKLSLHYMLSQLDTMTLPEPVREWLALSPFCTLPLEVRRNMKSVKKETSVPISNGAPLLLRWANRRSMLRMQRYAGAADKVRSFLAAPSVFADRLPKLLKRSLGMDPTANLEQAWCFHLSGAQTQYNTDQSCLNLLTEPVEAWRLLAPEQKAEMLEDIELPAERGFDATLPPTGAAGSVSALDAAGTSAADESGAGAAAWEQRLRELDAVLREHPELHRFSLLPDRSSVVVELQPIEYEEPSRQEVLPAWQSGSIGGASVPFRMLNRTVPREDYRVGNVAALPADLAADARTLPALRTLDVLRSYVVSLPFATEQGIWWKGKRYGGFDGEMPTEIYENWKDRPVLQGLLEMFARIDDALAASGEERMDVCGVQLLPMGERPDTRPWSLVSLYRDPAHPEMLYRLMPGEPDSPGVPMRRPYIVNSYHGAYLQKKHRKHVYEMDDFCYGMVPLNLFRPFEPRNYNEKHMEAWKREAVEYTIDGILARAESMENQSEPDALLDEDLESDAPIDEESEPAAPMDEQGESFSSSAAALGWRELLMRLCEDTALSHSLIDLEPQQMTPGQALAVSLAREIILTHSGSDAEAPERLRQLARRIRLNPSLRRQLATALFESLDRQRLGLGSRRPVARLHAISVTETEPDVAPEAAPDGTPEVTSGSEEASREEPSEMSGESRQDPTGEMSREMSSETSSETSGRRDEAAPNAARASAEELQGGESS